MAKEFFPDTWNELRFDDKGRIRIRFPERSRDSEAWILSYYTHSKILESLFGDLRSYSHRSQNLIRLVQKTTGKSNFRIVAHSMGGIVSRHAVSSDPSLWDAMDKILTVGTPNMGVRISPNLPGQFGALRPDSSFLRELNTQWNELYSEEERKWGVIGSVFPHIFTKNRTKVHGKATDLAGPGYISVQSALPYESWKDLTSENFAIPNTSDDYFGFKLLIRAQHRAQLHSDGARKGIRWILEN